MEKIDLWAVYQFECPHCDKISEVNDDFSWNGDEGCNTMEGSCDHCGKEFLLVKPDYL